MIAALFVERNGVYYNLPDVDPWDEERDARLYRGPWPVVAHPPCARWGRYWFGGPSIKTRLRMGDDDGCFEAALNAVRTYGGVLEHPAASYAWSAYGLGRPDPRGWSRDLCGGWSCQVDQRHYGHRARKRTWLYCVGPKPPPLIWGPGPPGIRIDQGFHSTVDRRHAIASSCSLTKQDILEP